MDVPSLGGIEASANWVLPVHGVGQTFPHPRSRAPNGPERSPPRGCTGESPPWGCTAPQGGFARERGPIPAGLPRPRSRAQPPHGAAQGKGGPEGGPMSGPVCSSPRLSSLLIHVEQTFPQRGPIPAGDLWVGQSAHATLTTVQTVSQARGMTSAWAMPGPR